MSWTLTFYSTKNPTQIASILEDHDRLIGEGDTAGEVAEIGYAKITHPDREHFVEFHFPELSMDDQALFEKCETMLELHKPLTDLPRQVDSIRFLVENLGPTLVVGDFVEACSGFDFLKSLEKSPESDKADEEKLRALLAKFNVTSLHETLPTSFHNEPEKKIEVIDRVNSRRICVSHVKDGVESLASRTQDFGRVVEADIPYLESPSLKVLSTSTGYAGEPVYSDTILLSSKHGPYCELTHTRWEKSVMSFTYRDSAETLSGSFVHREDYYLGIETNENPFTYDWTRIRVVDFEAMWKALYPNIEFERANYYAEPDGLIPLVRNWLSKRIPGAERIKLKASVAPREWKIALHVPSEAYAVLTQPEKRAELRRYLTVDPYFVPENGMVRITVDSIAGTPLTLEIPWRAPGGDLMTLADPRITLLGKRLEQLVRDVVKHPEAVVIEPRPSAYAVRYGIKVAKDDVKNVYGKHEQTLSGFARVIGFEGACLGIISHIEVIE